MYQQQPQNQQQPQHMQYMQAAPMPEKDMLSTILVNLKRTAKEYATAATESNCQVVRQMFTDLLHSTLNMQAHVYTIMKQQNMYSVAAQASKQEIDKQLKQHQQTDQQTQQFIQQKLGGQAGTVMHGQAPYGQQQQQQQQQQPQPQQTNQQHQYQQPHQYM